MKKLINRFTGREKCLLIILLAVLSFGLLTAFVGPPLAAWRGFSKANANNYQQLVVGSGDTYTRGVFMFNIGTLTNGIELENDGTTTSAFVIDNDGTLTTGIVLEGTIATGIDLSGATSTTDIKLQGGDTIINSTATEIAVSDKFCLENGECFDNGTDGTVTLSGGLLAVSGGAVDISHTNGLILENDETITNAVDGAVVCDGSFDITHANGLILENDDTITNPDANNIVFSDDLKLENADTISNSTATVIKFSERIAFENDEYIDNSTDGQLELGKAEVHDFQVETSIAASWSEPYDCTAAEEGAIIYADDNDDTQIGEICACMNTDGTGYEWANLTDASACDP